jgi:hypothetical protein
MEGDLWRRTRGRGHGQCHWDHSCDSGHVSGDRKSWLDGEGTTAFPFESVILISAYGCVMAAGNVV